MDIRPNIGNERPSWLGYIAGIAASAIGHAALLVLVFFVAPRYLHSETTAPPSYTVKIVDNIPAGDLGTHLPKLSGHKQAEPKRAEPKPEQIAKAEPPPPPEPPKVEPPKEPPPPPPPAEDKNAISLKTSGPTPTPTPPPVRIEPTPEPTPSAKSTHIAREVPRPKPRASAAPKARHERHRLAHPTLMAKAENTPSVEEQLAKIRSNLLKEQLKRDQENKSEDGDEEDEGDKTSTPSSGEGGGPVLADKNTAGKGYGVGSGTGSAGIQQDLQFLLYYRTVQQKIKDAWIFPGGSNDLTAMVTFSIGPDGALTGLKLAQSSKDSSFDDSVLRAIRKAAPFPPPPDKYRSEFAGGVEASFKLGELKS